MSGCFVNHVPTALGYAALQLSRLLHIPALECAGAPLVDVVFVHGIRGGAFATWRRKGVMNTDPQHTEGSLDHPYCWPSEWLAPDVPEARLLSMEYAAPASGWEVSLSYPLQPMQHCMTSAPLCASVGKTAAQKQRS